MRQAVAGELDGVVAEPVMEMDFRVGEEPFQHGATAPNLHLAAVGGVDVAQGADRRALRAPIGHVLVDAFAAVEEVEVDAHRGISDGGWVARPQCKAQHMCAAVGAQRLATCLVMGAVLSTRTAPRLSNVSTSPRSP